MRDEKIGDWLDELASESSAPGGGAAAALDAAVGAALISMVCNLTIGRPKYAEYDDTNKAALEAATKLPRRPSIWPRRTKQPSPKSPTPTSCRAPQTRRRRRVQQPSRRR